MSDQPNQPPEPPYKTAAEVYGLERDQPPPAPGMSHSPGLRPVEDSPVPNMDRAHVIGPQQAAADPVLAGLDTNHNPMTRAENRVITRENGENVVPRPDSESDALPGPSAVSAPPAPNAAEEAAKITPTAVLAPQRPASAAAEAPAAPAAAEFTATDL